MDSPKPQKLKVHANITNGVKIYFVNNIPYFSKGRTTKEKSLRLQFYAYMHAFWFNVLRSDTAY